MLWRALGHVKNGCYVDVGAQHPVEFSVTRAFYEHDWRGINIEPVEAWYNLLKQDRPEDITLRVALGAEEGEITFYEVTGQGLFTLDADVATTHAPNGFEVRSFPVKKTPLDAIFSAYPKPDIHFLKIDVEATEEQVLRGWRSSAVKPWILIIESTRPLTQDPSYQDWEALVLEKGYTFAYFDGLNRFYVAPDKKELLAHFTVDPNVFDGFNLSRTTPYCYWLVQNFDSQLATEVEKTTLHRI